VPLQYTIVRANERRTKAIGSRLRAGLDSRDQVIGDKHNATNSLNGKADIKSGRINVFSMKLSVKLCRTI
jgi:hypothetical protein